MPENSNYYPLISIIIPTYNRKNLLSEAVDSVLTQNYHYYEIIIIDDGSSDQTITYLDKLKFDLAAIDKPTPTIKVKSIPHNGHPGYVRNRGIEMAEGELIAFLDSDDLWNNDKLIKQVDYLYTHPEVSILHTAETWLRGAKTVSQTQRKHKREGDVFNDALAKCILGPSTVILRRTLIDEILSDSKENLLFNEQLEVGEDYELWLRICDRYAVGYINEPLIIKRGGLVDQLSVKYGQIEIFHLEALYTLLKCNKISDKNKPATLDMFKRKIEIYTNGCLKRGKKDEAQLWQERSELY